MTRNHRIIVIAVAIVGVSVSFAGAQIVVTDPATTIKNAAIALLKNDVVDLLTNQATRLRKMAKRLSLATNLDKYSLPDPPAWRIHWFIDDGTFLYANPYTAALNYGDGTGQSFEEVARARVAPGAELAGLAGEGEDTAALDVIASELATLDVADSTIIAGTDQTGQLRYNGRREQAAIDALDADVIDPSPSQSATAILEKISGAGLIRARQQQARLQFLTGIVEQLLVDNKRSRDTETAVMNMQFGRLRDGRAANTSLIAGAADDLRRWRLPR